jgi:Phosphotransferase enzyme family
MASDVGALVAAARRWPEGGNGAVEPVSTPWSWSHSLFRGDLDGQPVALKVFGDVSRDEHLREWDALSVLSAEGLAPVPVHATADAGPPVVVMRWVAGAPRRLAELTAAQVEAFAAAHGRVHALSPRTSRPANGTPAAALARTSGALASLGGHEATRPALSRALRAAADWTRSVESAWSPTDPLPAAYCRGDPNWGNYLWSGDQVVLVDLEDAGFNDPAFELADMVEHVANRDLSPPAIEHLIALWHLDQRRDDVLRWRRLAACFWLTVLAARERRGLRPMQVTAAEQARRSLDLLTAP